MNDYYVRFREKDENDEYVIFDNLKNLSFAPEYDPTLSRLSICEFNCDIVTDVSYNDFIGQFVDLCEVRPASWNTVLAGYYWITEAHQAGPKIVTIRAQSLLEWLERRTFDYYYPGIGYQDTIENFVLKLFSSVPENKDDQWLVNIPVVFSGYDPSSWKNKIIYGYCPPQTARERLMYLCQAEGLIVEQWGEESKDGLVIKHSRYYMPDDDQQVINAVIPLNAIFDKPYITTSDAVMSCDVTYYSNFQLTERAGDDWGKIVLVPGWDDSEVSGLVQPEIALYYQFETTRYTNGTLTEGNAFAIKDNLLMVDDADHRQEIAWKLSTYYCNHEIEADILQLKDSNSNEYIWPGYAVKIYIDPDTTYNGIVRSCAFTFGLLARAHLVISTNLATNTMVTITFHYEYKGIALGEKKYKFPYGDHPRFIYHPIFYGDVFENNGVIVRDKYIPQSDKSYISNVTSNVTQTIQYTREVERDP